jgi:RNA polymerase sigma factor (sigma-70 family)
MNQKTDRSLIVPPHLIKLANAETYQECKKVVRKALKHSPLCSETANLEDIYQDAWYILLRNWSIAGYITLYRCRYLARTARNLCYTMMRQRLVVTREDPETVADALPDIPPPDQPFLEHYSAVFDALRDKYGLEKINDPLNLPPDDPGIQALKIQLKQLPDNQWKILWLKYYCHYSYKEIAALLDTSEAYVGQLINRTKENIRVQQQQTHTHGTH